MKIVASNGKELKLFPDTALEMQRVNPWFNDYGEQSLPVAIPDCGYNRQVLGFPNDLANTQKAGGRSDASIHDGAFHIACRQAVLSAGGDEGISCSFYCNEGSFYEKIDNITLAEVVKDQKLTFATVEAAVSYVQSLMTKVDEKLACIPVCLQNQDTGKICIVNRPNYDVILNGKYGLAGAYEQTETIGEATVTVPVGFYVSPQIRCSYVLKEAFRKMGYTLDMGFFGETEPFASMVLLNTNIDTIVNKEIRFEQLVPDCTVSDLMDTFRYKFCCEFVPDETSRTVRIMRFDEIMAEEPAIDLTSRLVKKPVIDHSEPFRQLKLSCNKGEVVTWEFDTFLEKGYTMESADYLGQSLGSIRKKMQNIYLNQATGLISQRGSSGSGKVVASLACDYCAESEGLETQEFNSPDTMVNMMDMFLFFLPAPVAGTSRCLNSRIVYDNADNELDSQNDKQTQSELPIMLCGVAHDIYPYYEVGCMTGYVRWMWNGVMQQQQAWDYSLLYNGKEGLYESFWRNYDLLLRNGFRKVTAQLLLTDVDKMTIPSCKPVAIDGQHLLPDVINYVVGKKQITECTFLTTRILQPATSSPSWTEYYDHDI